MLEVSDISIYNILLLKLKLKEQIVFLFSLVFCPKMQN